MEVGVPVQGTEGREGTLYLVLQENRSSGKREIMMALKRFIRLNLPVNAEYYTLAMREARTGLAQVGLDHGSHWVIWLRAFGEMNPHVKGI